MCVCSCMCVFLRGYLCVHLHVSLRFGCFLPENKNMPESNKQILHFNLNRKIKKVDFLSVYQNGLTLCVYVSEISNSLYLVI